VLDCRPVTVSGDNAPVAVNPPGLEVTVNEVAGIPTPGVNETVAAPLLYGRLVPTLVAVPIVGTGGTSSASSDEAVTPRMGIRKYLLPHTIDRLRL
jgi:hypothetical protein